MLVKYATRGIFILSVCIMRKYILLIITSLFTYAAIGATTPLAITAPAATVVSIGKNPDLSKLKARDIEKMIGRRLTIKEKIGWLFVRRQFKKGLGNPDVDINRKARKAKTFGTIALIALLAPPVSIISIPFAIVAIVMGSQVRKVDPDNVDAKKAITRGIITLALIAVMIIFVMAFITAFTFT